MYVQRRKRLRNNPRDDYEFEMLDDGEEEGLTTGKRGVGAGVGGKKKSRRAGELYDAFAGESDEEFFSEDEVVAGMPYRDADEEEEWREKGGEEDGSEVSESRLR